MPSWNAKFRPANSRRALLPLLALLLLAGACRSRRPHTPLEPVPAASGALNHAAWSDSCFVRWTTLAYKGQFTYRDTRLDQKAQYRLHMERGRRIWLSISLLGVEGMRALITPDSVWMVNRLEQSVYRARYDTVATWLGYAPPLADFQRLLLGLIPAEVACRDSSAERRLRCRAGPRLLLDLLLLAGAAPCVEEATLQQPGQSMRLQHANFKHQPKGLLLPLRSLLTTEGEQTFTLLLEHRSVEVDPADINFSFRIPEAFE
jgi:hypothetical protein